MQRTQSGKHQRSAAPGRFAAGLVVAALACVAARADAAVLRRQVDQRGDFVLIGNTLGWDCSPGVPLPIVGNVSNMCGASTMDTAPDMYWRADDPVGGATASLMYTADDARSTAVLALPPGAVVTYARLYWGALKAGNQADPTITLDRQGGFSSNVTADAAFTIQQGGNNYYYQSTADVTDVVAANGPGGYRVSGVAALPVANLNQFTMYANWAMVVFYRLESEPARNLALFDGLDRVAPPNNIVEVSLTGFRVPTTGFDGKLGVIVYEGDDQATGDLLLFNNTLLFNALNPQINFFNGTRSHFGAATSAVGDLPQLQGVSRSLSGMDLDVVDIKHLLKSGDTSASILATSSGDVYLLGAFVTSIATFEPDLSTSTKTVTNATHPMGPTRPGDELEYTITVTNTGNDTAINSVLNDALPLGLTYKASSLRVDGVMKTDAAGDDQGEYLVNSRTVRVRLGNGADATAGGSLAPGASAMIVFRATIDMGATGVLENQGVITAEGQNGNPVTDYPTDGNGVAAGSPPTPITVDECAMDGDCPMARPHCLTDRSPRVCVECRVSAHCPAERPICNASTNSCGSGCTGDGDCAATPATPACLPGGTCGQCSATNSAACQGMTPLCDVGRGVCVECVNNGSCAPPRPICQATTSTCVECVANAHCPPGQVCDPTSGTCRACTTNADCGGATPVCNTATGACGQCSAMDASRCSGATPVCDAATGTCVGCTENSQCSGGTPVCLGGVCRACMADAQCPPARPLCLPGGACGVCTALDATRCTGATPVCDAATGTCVGCTSNAHCAGATPVCETMTRTCRGCMSDGECPAAAPACLSSGACGQCSAANSTACTGATPRCDTARAVCVGCLTSDDCAGTTPFCAPASNTCVPCQADGPPSCPDPSRPACQTVGALAGACTECRAGNATRCGGQKPVCLASVGLCGCTDSDGDAECGGPMSGVVCSGPAGLCVPGCSTAPGRNRCPAGQTCSNVTGAVGACLQAMGCATNAQCVPPRGVCDTTALPGTCVQCLMDAQCPAPLICDTAGSKSCVECTAARAAACRADLAGSRCLAAGTCGCSTDMDCGGPASGRVCNVLLGRCTVGCRGVGGNGCPPPQVCTSANATAGVCVSPAGPMDGGADRPLDATASDARPDSPVDGARDLAGDGPRDGAAEGIRDATPERPLDGAPGPDAAAPVADAPVADAGSASDGPAIMDGRPAGRRDAGSPAGYLGGGGCSCAVGGSAEAPGVLLAPLGLLALLRLRSRGRPRRPRR